MESTLTEIVKSYYSLVDEGKLDDLLKLFSQDIYYRRCEREIKGFPQLEKFYKEERTLRGKHTIVHIIKDPDGSIAVQGSFGGYKNTQPIAIGFVDLFFFDKEGKICKRHTYTDQGDV